MYQLDPDTCYTMPTCGKFRDPRPWENGGMRYGRVTSLSVTFATDGELAGRCLPKPFRPAEDATVSVVMQQCDDVDWLAGRSYMLLIVNVAAVFDGQRDRDVRGDYGVVVWEDMCEPIIGGREHSGVPKVFADIDFQRDPGSDSCSCEMSRFDHRIMDLSASGLTPMDRATCDQMEIDRKNANWMCYKYIPSLENDGADVSYATVYPSSGQVKAAWSGQGRCSFSPRRSSRCPRSTNTST